MKKSENPSVAILGAGSWGTAIAVSLAHGGHHPVLWGRSEESIRAIREDRENKKYLEGVMIPEEVELTSDLEYAVREKDVVIYVVPAQVFRGTFTDSAGFLGEGTIVVNCAKGIEVGTQKRISEIAAEIRPDLPFAVVSGPSHAEEAGRFLPTTLVAASKDPECAEYIQDLFMTDVMRVYANDDVVGVEVGGALKNIIALHKSPAFVNGSSISNATNVGAIVDGTWDSGAAKDLFGDNYAAAKLPTVGGVQLSGFGGFKLLGVKPQTDKDKLEACK